MPTNLATNAVQRIVLSLLLFVLLPFAPRTVTAGELAIVIDDVGYHLERGRRVIELPSAVTLAVLPFAPHTQTLVKQAELAGHDIIVHQPMEPHPAGHVRTERDTLTLSMSSNELRSTFSRSLDAVPQLKGVSNHTGSLLTSHREPMLSLMAELDVRGLFFLDSRTTADTVAEDVAREVGIPTLKRDVFLDHDRHPRAIEGAFNQAVSIAQQRGHAVLVGHPYPETLTFLESRLSRTTAKQVRLVSATQLARRLHSQHLANRPRQTASGLASGLASLRISLDQ